MDDLGDEGSIEWYERSLSVDPMASDIFFNIAYYYSERNIMDKSIEFYDKCIQVDPTYLNAYLNQANNYSILNDMMR